MQVIGYNEFRNNISKSLKMVSDDGEVIIVFRGTGRSIVLMSLEEYKSIHETFHLASKEANQERLDEAIAEMRSGKFSKHNLIED